MEQTQKKKRKPVMLLILFGLVAISIAAVNGQYSKASDNKLQTATVAPTQTQTITTSPQASTLASATPVTMTQSDKDRLTAIKRLNSAIKKNVQTQSIYTADTWAVYQNALKTAKAVDTTKATTKKINDAAKALENATKALVTQADYDKAQAIKALNTAISAAVQEGSTYTASTWTAYETALNAAKAINTDTAVADEINAAANTLSNATAALVAQADYDKAQAIERLNKAINTAVEEESVYTVATWTSYENALNAAKAINTNTATTTEINAAAKTLEDMTVNLKKIVYVTDITVKGKNDTTVITKKDGTLQMSATVAPTNADDKDIVWSVENLTGSATITANGLLKSVSNGTVTVKAINTASGVVGTLTVTIENQDYIGYFENSDVTFILGNWAINKGAVVPTNSGEHRAILNGSLGSDYTINVTAKFVSGTNTSQRGYGIYYRASYTDTGLITGYCFQFDPGAGSRFSIRKVVNGKEMAAFKSVAMKDIFGSSFDIYAVHDIKIVTNGADNVIYVDGTKVLEFTDTDYTTGYVGFRTWNNSVTQFISASVK